MKSGRAVLLFAVEYFVVVVAGLFKLVFVLLFAQLFAERRGLREKVCAEPIAERVDGNISSDEKRRFCVFAAVLAGLIKQL